MPRYRRKKDPLDLLPPIVGFILLCVFFVPGFRQMLGALFVVALWLLGLGLVGLIGWLVWRRLKAGAERDDRFDDNLSRRTAPAPITRAERNNTVRGPTFVHSDRPEAPCAVWTRELLSELEWKRFEDVVAAYSRELGYEAKTTRIGADGGVDVQLFRSGQSQPVMIIQCKAWDAYRVGVKPVRELFGVMAADKVGNGAFFTTGEFTAEAEEWARDKNLDLVNGSEFLNRIGQLAPEAQDKLLDLATEGDYTTPTCPSCGVKMVLRTASKGANEGSSFWGCRNFPRCKRTFAIPRS